MIEVIEDAFAPELLSVSHKARKLADLAWTACRIGGVVPISALSGHTEKAEDSVSILSRAGIVRYSLGGFINRDQKRESLSIIISDDLAGMLPADVKRKEFDDVLFRNYGTRLMPYCRSELTEPLAIMMTSLIFYATPDKPAFVNTVVRKASKICAKNYVECSNLLEFYLHRFLGLVEFETGSMINLSVRSKQRVRMHPKIWEIYARAPKESQDGMKKPEHKPPPSDRLMDQERKLRGYFPWLKF